MTVHIGWVIAAAIPCSDCPEPDRRSYFRKWYEHYAAEQDELRRLRERVAELEEVERKAVAQSEYIQSHGLTDYEMARLKAWVADLQSGMYVNCVYCGHRYGPGETTPVSMADALKAHIETCPKHPMSALKARVGELENRVVDAEHGFKLALGDAGEYRRQVAEQVAELEARLNPPCPDPSIDAFYLEKGAEDEQQ